MPKNPPITKQKVAATNKVAAVPQKLGDKVSNIKKMFDSLGTTRKIQLGVLAAFLLFVLIFTIVGASRLKAVDKSAILSANTQSTEIFVNDLFEVQVHLLPEGNDVGGVDAVLTYAPEHLEPTVIAKDPDSPFDRFDMNLDYENGIIYMTSVLAPEDQLVWVTEPTVIANITFKAVAETNATTISFDYQNGNTTDSNVAVIYQGEVTDALQVPPNHLELQILPEGAEPTPTPTPIPTPTPTSEPSPSPSSTPTPSPSPTSDPNRIEEIVIHRATLKRGLTRLLPSVLEVIATDSLAPDVSLFVVDDKTKEVIGDLRYNQESDSYYGEFNVDKTLRKIIVQSNTGAYTSARVRVTNEK